MNMINLREANIKEINASELKQINGGNPFVAALGVMSACIYVYNNWDDFVEGVKEGFASTQDQDPN